jgi:catechol 2,3-dioxygenase-like lactoylglutathione lyase family enzyme
MLIGAHSILYSRDAEADRAFLRDALGLAGVDAGEGWLIFGLPPSEVAIHPSRRNGEHEFYLMCDDAGAFVAAMKRRRIRCGALIDAPWGRLTEVTLPGGGKLGVYEPRHPRPKPMAVTKRKRTRRRG